MHTVDPAAVECFMRDQVTCWNGHDRAGFMALYRDIAPVKRKRGLNTLLTLPVA